MEYSHEIHHFNLLSAGEGAVEEEEWLDVAGAFRDVESASESAVGEVVGDVAGLRAPQQRRHPTLVLVASVGVVSDQSLLSRRLLSHVVENAALDEAFTNELD